MSLDSSKDLSIPYPCVLSHSYAISYAIPYTVVTFLCGSETSEPNDLKDATLQPSCLATSSTWGYHVLSLSDSIHACHRIPYDNPMSLFTVCCPRPGPWSLRRPTMLSVTMVGVPLVSHGCHVSSQNILMIYGMYTVSIPAVCYSIHSFFRNLSGRCQILNPSRSSLYAEIHRSSK